MAKAIEDSTRSRRLIQCLEDEDRPLSMTEISVLTGIHYFKIRKLIEQMARDGVIGTKLCGSCMKLELKNDKEKISLRKNEVE